MKNLAFTPAPHTKVSARIDDVFRADKAAATDWVKTSVSLRAETKAQLKAFAAGHDMRIQEVIDEALTAYLN